MNVPILENVCMILKILMVVGFVSWVRRDCSCMMLMPWSVLAKIVAITLAATAQSSTMPTVSSSLL